MPSRELFGVNSGQRSVVTCVHRLQHVERLTATDFADDDAVRTHTQAVDEQFALAHRPVSLQVRRPGFKTRDVRLFQLEFGRVFDRDDAFSWIDECRQRVQQRCLTGAGTAGDDDVQLRLDSRFEQFEHAGVIAFFDEIRTHQLVL